MSDAALLDDLEKLPLNAAHLSRSVAIRHRWRNRQLELEPIDTLAPGENYTLALPRKAAVSPVQALATTLQVDDSPLSGAALRATFPPAEARSVPSDLAFALVSFDGVVHDSEHGLWLEDARGFAHPARVEDIPCEAYDSAAIHCIRVLPSRPLEPGSRYTLRSGGALTDGHGATVTELRAEFSTQSALDPIVPVWQQTPCAIDELALPIGCALVTDQRVDFQLFQNPAMRVLAQLADQRIAVLPASMSSPLGFQGLVADRTYTLTLESIDASLHAEQISWPLRTAAPLPKLSISEVNANPHGAEPQQEYVELWNFGDESQSLAGMSLSDSASDLGAALPEQAVLAPGARALLVSDTFDPADERDPRPAPGSLLIRVGKSVTRAGLANTGERLYLRTAAGERVSTAPSSPTAREGQCLARATGDPRSPDPAEWVLAACSPGS